MTQKTPKVVSAYGPGVKRMRKRLSPKAVEALRLDTLRLQAVALEYIEKQALLEQDRRTYKEYPPSDDKPRKGGQS